MAPTQNWQINVAAVDENDETNSLLLSDEVDKFIAGVRRWNESIFGKPSEEHTETLIRILLSQWNIFLQLQKGIHGTSAIESHIPEYISEFLQWLRNTLDVRISEGNKKWIRRWLSRWNIFLQARAGESPVTKWQIFLTFLGALFYILDMSSDMWTAIYHGYNRNWWLCGLTLLFIYVAVIINTARKWINKQLRWFGLVDRLRYFGSLFVNGPDLNQYWRLCNLEWKLFISPNSNAHLVPEWQACRLNMAYQKFVEGLCEACPQAILQLWLLLPDLHRNITLTDYIRIASTCISLCAAGAALINWEKFVRTRYNIDLTTSELLILHAWVVPVTVSRLLSLVLLLTLHLYWGLACIALHTLLFGTYWYNTRCMPRTRQNFLFGCLETVWFLISPFVVGGSSTIRRAFHAIHFLCNASVTVVWTLMTPLMCKHQSVYTILICIFNGTMFGIGLLGWVIHEKYWSCSYSQTWHNKLRP